VKPGDVVQWLDAGLAIILCECEIQDPLEIIDLDSFLTEEKDIPYSRGWLIKLIESGEILSVHEETLEPQDIVYS